MSFWSVSRKKSLASQRKSALRNRFLRELLCDNFNPGYNRKKLIRKRIILFDGVCFRYGEFFQSVQCTASKTYQSNSIDRLVLPTEIGNLSVSGQSQYVSDKLFPLRYATIFSLFVSVLKLTHTLLLTLCIVQNGQGVSSGESVFFRNWENLLFKNS